MIRRRQFLTMLGGAAAAWPLAVRAQQPTISRIGVLLGLPEDDPEAEKWIQALVEGLSQLGWKRDKDMRLDIRWATDPARMQHLAKELVELRPDLIQVTTTPATAAVLRETHTIPVVFSNVSNPLTIPMLRATVSRVNLMISCASIPLYRGVVRWLVAQ